MKPTIEKIVELLTMIQEEDYQSIGAPEEEIYLTEQGYIYFFSDSTDRPNQQMLTAKGLKLLHKYKEIKEETLMKIYHYVTIEGKVSSFTETTYQKAKVKEIETKNSFVNLPGEVNEKGVYVYYYDDYLEEVRGHIVASSEVEAKALLNTQNI